MNHQMFKQMTCLTQEQLKKFVEHELKNHYNQVYSTANYVYAPGDIEIGLVAHLDVVYDEEDRNDMLVFRDPEYGVMWAPEGLGADDRAGVMMICELISEGYRPSVFFTTNEESNAAGAMALARKKCPSKLSYIIELDRQGYKDSVYYNCDNPDFEEFINSYGFETALGTYTDISILCPAWGVAGVNLSVGYYDEHSAGEFLVESHWDATYRKVCNMLNSPAVVRWQYIAASRYDYMYPKSIKGGVYNGTRSDSQSRSGK